MGRQLTDIACTVRQVREKAIAVADGTMDEQVDKATGEVREREKWFWLPLSMVEIEPSDYGVGDTVTVTLPEWKAQDVGLI